jgi:hypothetical protein
LGYGDAIFCGRSEEGGGGGGREGERCAGVFFAAPFLWLSTVFLFLESKKCPDNPCNPVANKGKESRVRSHHETINECFKTWGILSQVYRHNIARYGEKFRAVAIIMQLTIEYGSPLFQVDYEDKGVGRIVI